MAGLNGRPTRTVNGHPRPLPQAPPPPDRSYWVVDRIIAWVCIFVTFCAGFALGAALMSIIILH